MTRNQRWRKGRACRFRRDKCSLRGPGPQNRLARGLDFISRSRLSVYLSSLRNKDLRADESPSGLTIPFGNRCSRACELVYISSGETRSTHEIMSET